jgi:membrane protease YdiL (CAAX protease family)
MSKSRKKILVFLVLTFVLSSIFYYLIISAGSIQNYSLGLMWCPGISAIITQLLFERSIKGLGWSARPFKYILASYGLPLAYCLVVYGIVWLTGLGKFDPNTLAQQIETTLQRNFSSPAMAVLIYVLIAATIGIVQSILSAAGEEIGWRGLFVPELAREFSFTKTALISGGIWSLWHYPVLLFSDYKSTGTPVWFSLICFTIMVIGISFPFAWLRLKSGSLWTGVLLHASHNLFVQAIFTPLTGNTGITPYIIDEFGAGLALAAIVVAYLFWRKRGQLPQAA